jgi:hypothetical protein
VRASDFAPVRLWRSAAAFLIAPLTAPFLYLATATAFGGFVSFDLAIFTGEIAYATALVGGLPLHIMLSKLGWVSLHDYMVFGFLLGAVSALIGEHAPIAFTALMQAGLAAGCGAIAAAVFWLLVRPDRVPHLRA